MTPSLFFSGELTHCKAWHFAGTLATTIGYGNVVPRTDKVIIALSCLSLCRFRRESIFNYSSITHTHVGQNVLPRLRHVWHTLLCLYDERHFRFYQLSTYHTPIAAGRAPKNGPARLVHSTGLYWRWRNHFDCHSHRNLCQSRALVNT